MNGIYNTEAAIFDHAYIAKIFYINRFTLHLNRNGPTYRTEDCKIGVRHFIIITNGWLTAVVRK